MSCSFYDRKGGTAGGADPPVVILMSCQYCGIYHTPDLLWCPESMGMTALPPPAGNFGCTLSSHERWCTCPMRDWRNEMAAHTRALIARYSEMVSRRLEREAAYADVARTFVCNSIESALRLLFPIETHMLPHRVIDDREWTLHQIRTGNPPWPIDDPRWCDALAAVALSRRERIIRCGWHSP